MKESLQVLGDKSALSEPWCKGDAIEDCSYKQQSVVSRHSMVKVLQQNT